MDMSQYGPFAAVVAIAAALAAAFSLLILKAIGTVARWTWLIDNSPPFIVTAGARAVAVALIAATFVLISRNNYPAFLVGAVVFGLIAFWLIVRFDRLRKVHIFKIPLVQKNGTQATDSKGKARFGNVVIGTEEDLSSDVKKILAEMRIKHGGLSLTDFMAGFGARGTNNPEALWTRERLAEISNRIT